MSAPVHDVGQLPDGRVFYAMKFVEGPRLVAIAIFGLAIGLVLAYLVAMSPDPKTGEHYYAQIMIPGAIVGLLVGYATARYGGKTAASAA